MKRSQPKRARLLPPVIEAESLSLILSFDKDLERALEDRSRSLSL